MSINVNSRIRACGARKFLRKRCLDECIFAPYFYSDEGTANFKSVHKIFGANNISKLLINISIEKRANVVFTLCLEAEARLRDPVYGCMSEIYALQNQANSWAANLQQFYDQNTFAGAPVGGEIGEEFARELLLRYQRSAPSMPPWP
ncbi:LOB domain-containing protein 18-like [Impatiens glandulifera]|uniref:LOB domain-containing protein 18-like n=1 Tax=Impatiens glandulifera TaxID=253017 RepID=UPI001FB080C2|nr:LOB domain-containing protein 18-like [Impatiens glandulifera]